MACREQNRFKHELRWDISKNHTLRRRRVHGWLISVTGCAPHPCSFSITNRPLDADHPDRTGIVRSKVSSPGAAMTQALAIVHALRGLNTGWRQ